MVEKPLTERIASKRREFIKGAIASGATVGLAGCSGGGGDGDGDGGNGTGGDGGDGGRPGPESGTEYEELPTMRLMTVGRDQGPQSFEQSQLLQEMWGDLGFDFELDVVDWGLHAEKRADLDFETFIVAWSGSIERLYPYYNLYHSFHSEFAYPGGGNFMQWEEASQQYDEAVENFFQTMDREEGAKWAKYCQAIIAENVPVLMLTHPDSLALANQNVWNNYQAMPGPWPFWNVPSLEALENTGETDQVLYANQPEHRGFPNPLAMSGAVDWYSNTFHYDTLVRLDSNGEPYPSAAEDWETVDDTTVEVTLRDDLQFTDGEDVTAEDVQFSWDYIVNQEVPYLSSDVEPYESSEVVDDQTIRFNLANPFGGFIQVSLYRVPILPQHIWDGITEEEGLEHPSEWSDPDTTGSGPFVLDDYSPDEQIVWSVNEDYYRADEFDFSELIFTMYGNLTSAAGDVANGNAAFTDQLSPTLWNQHNEDHVLQHSQEGIRTEGIWMNHTKEPWMDVNVRKAMAYATDYQSLVENVYQGQATNATSPISPVNETYHNSEAKEYTRDLDQALGLLEESGFRWDDNNNLLKPVDWEPETTYVSVENEWV